MKRWIVPLLLMLVLSGCAEAKPSNKLTILAGAHSMDCTPVNQEIDSEDIFRSFFAEEALSEIMKVTPNETLSLKFEGDQPTKVTIKDILLRSDGGYQYPEKLSPETLLIQNNGGFSFVVGRNLASALSSQFDPAKRDYRGFKVNSAWESGDAECVFVVREK